MASYKSLACPLPRLWAEKSQLELFGLFIFLDFGVGIVAGVYYVSAFHDDNGECCNFYLWGLVGYVSLEVLGLLTSFASLVTSGVSFGWADMGPGKCAVQLVFGCWMLAVTVVCGVLPALWFPSRADQGLLTAAVIFTVTGLVGVRSWAFVAPAPLMIVVGVLVTRVMWYKTMMVVAVAAYTRYLRDQRLVLCILAQASFAASCGALAQKVYIGAAHWSLAVVCAAGCILVPYVNLLMRRRRRYLPPSLQRVKFVRLGYLRRLLSEGGRIRRCQDLPEDAFGDPGKAAHIAILSHRWLNRYTCDVPTYEQPCGLKLAALLQRLERHFSPGRKNFFWGRATRWHAASCIGGWDALVFFDFMSVPQESLDAAGKVVPRTQAELEIFQECLPHMGVLYSLFPVLALTDTPQGDTSHEYFGSGWCLCEFNIAMLGQQLQLHSAQLLNAKNSLAACSSMQMSADAAQKFRQSAHAEFAAMHFTHESDRIVAQDVLEGFLAKRLLLDLTRSGDAQELERVLEQFAGEQQLRAMLEQPVDGQLNTLLHVAVDARQPKAAQLLLSRGARVEARNLRGDKPAQRFGLPRLGAAAAICRSWREPEAAFGDLKAARDDLEAETTLDDIEAEVASEISVYSV